MFPSTAISLSKKSRCGIKPYSAEFVMTFLISLLLFLRETFLKIADSFTVSKPDGKTTDILRNILCMTPLLYFLRVSTIFLWASMRRSSFAKKSTSFCCSPIEGNTTVPVRTNELFTFISCFAPILTKGLRNLFNRRSLAKYKSTNRGATVLRGWYTA